MREIEEQERQMQDNYYFNKLYIGGSYNDEETNFRRKYNEEEY